MSFYHLPRAWNPGFVMPDYVMAEPMERGTYTTKWLPRGTVSTLRPDEFARPVGQRLLGRNTAGLGSLGGSSLAGSSLAGSSLLPDDQVYELLPLGDEGQGPLPAFGATSSKMILARMSRLPVSQRAEFLRYVLDGIDKRLWADLAAAQKEIEKTGVNAAIAMRIALAKVLDQGLYREAVELGRKKRRPRRGLLGYQAMGEDGTSSEPWEFANITRDHRKSSNMFHQPRFQAAWTHALSKLGGDDLSKVKSGQAPFAKFENLSDGNRQWGIYWNGSVLAVKPVPPNPPGFWGRVWGTVKSVGKGLTQIPKALKTAGKKLLGSIKDLACGIVSSEPGKLAVAGGATYAGGPEAGKAGYEGAKLADGMCNPAAAFVPLPGAAGGGMPSWLLPAALVGGGAVLLLVLTKKKS